MKNTKKKTEVIGQQIDFFLKVNSESDASEKKH